ncbi:TetR family transcriptional regulator [Sorangium cellulosum]|uniref:TetR family transcriptional regulator n=1 Tax=Sorangium cellulosum TaxID=56 RepID=A0A2L0EL30_SORCE|nr:TetR/AcrR family transcriptional regulator [Sorangium cellulosum]AUX40013.1 TetR family transcriptional regulator [Sorangium cellulosum]
MTSPPGAKQQRGEPLVAKILETTLGEIARVGYEHLSIEEVAARAGVNKTTIYRRWPTPEVLALCAFERFSDNEGISDTGSLRGDLIDYLRRYREVCRSPSMLSLTRMLFAGGLEGKLGALIRERIEKDECGALVMFQRAIERGELPGDTDIELVRDLLLGSAQNLILFRHEQCTDEKIARVVDIMLLGAAHGGRAQRAPSAPPERARASAVTARRQGHVRRASGDGHRENEPPGDERRRR